VFFFYLWRGKPGNFAFDYGGTDDVHYCRHGLLIDRVHFSYKEDMIMPELELLQDISNSLNHIEFMMGFIMVVGALWVWTSK